MTMIKRGISGSTISMAKSVYVCASCGHTEMKNENAEVEMSGVEIINKKCPICEIDMDLIFPDDSKESNTHESLSEDSEKQP